MFVFSLFMTFVVYCKNDDDDDDVPIDLSPPQVGSGSIDCANSPLNGGGGEFRLGRGKG